MYSEIIYLIQQGEGEEKDEYGDRRPVEHKKECYASMKSIGQNEFYQAQTAGMKPEIKLEIADFSDYNGEKELIHNGIRYKVLRTYRTVTNSMELTCYGGVREV